MFYYSEFEFLKQEVTHCVGDAYGIVYDTYNHAIIACRNDQNCGAIYDDYCDGDGFKLCSSVFVPQTSTIDSCLYSYNTSKPERFVSTFDPSFTKL